MEGKALVYDNIQIQYVWWGLNVDQHIFICRVNWRLSLLGYFHLHDYSPCATF